MSVSNPTAKARWMGRGSALALAASLALTGAVTAPAQAAPAAQSTVSAAAKPKDHSRDCTNKARKAAKTHKSYKYWVCIGKDVKYFKKKKPGPSPAVAKVDSKDDLFTGYGVPDAKGISKAKLQSQAGRGGDLTARDILTMTPGASWC